MRQTWGGESVYQCADHWNFLSMEERRWRAAGGGEGHQTALLFPPAKREGGGLVESTQVLRAGNAQGATSVEYDGICHAALDPRNCGSKKRAATKSYMHGARRRAGVPMSFWREGACQHEVQQTCLASQGIFQHFQNLRSIVCRPRSVQKKIQHAIQDETSCLAGSL